MSKPINYAEIVSYEDMDPFKVSATEAAASTAHNLERHGYAELPASRGESCFVWDEGNKKRAGVIEGLGTKNLVTDEVDAWDENTPSRYGAIAQDSIAMIGNDLAVSGAKPQLLWIHLSAGISLVYRSKNNNRF